jgi:hypothetical protein
MKIDFTVCELLCTFIQALRRGDYLDKRLRARNVPFPGSAHCPPELTLEKLENHAQLV